MEKQRFTSVKRKKCCEIAKGHISKIEETAHRASSTEAAYSQHSIAIHSISMAGYVTAYRLLSAVNSQPGSLAVSVIFEKLLLAISPHFSPVLLKQTFVYLAVLNKYSLANLCPSMMYFDPLDFSECPSEKVMFLLTPNVYI